MSYRELNGEKDGKERTNNSFQSSEKNFFSKNAPRFVIRPKGQKVIRK